MKKACRRAAPDWEFAKMDMYTFLTKEITEDMNNKAHGMRLLLDNLLPRDERFVKTTNARDLQRTDKGHKAYVVQLLALTPEELRRIPRFQDVAMQFLQEILKQHGFYVGALSHYRDQLRLEMEPPSRPGARVILPVFADLKKRELNQIIKSISENKLPKLTPERKDENTRVFSANGQNFSVTYNQKSGALVIKTKIAEDYPRSLQFLHSAEQTPEQWKIIGTYVRNASKSVILSVPTPQ